MLQPSEWKMLHLHFCLQFVFLFWFSWFSRNSLKNSLAAKHCSNTHVVWPNYEFVYIRAVTYIFWYGVLKTNIRQLFMPCHHLLPARYANDANVCHANLAKHVNAAFIMSSWQQGSPTTAKCLIVSFLHVLSFVLSASLLVYILPRLVILEKQFCHFIHAIAKVTKISWC